VVAALDPGCGVDHVGHRITHPAHWISAVQRRRQTPPSAPTISTWSTLASWLVGRYGVKAHAPKDRPWGVRDFVIVDPTGVLWRIGQNSELA
jgi:hypothetical protein